MFYPFSSGQEDIVKDGLVLWLDAGDRTSYPGGGTVWRDLTPNANNGTLTNGPTFNSGNGGSIVLDGVNDYIQLNTLTALPNLQTGDSITIGCWIRKTSTSSWQPIITKIDSSNWILRNYELTFSGSGLNAPLNSISFFYRNAGNTTWNGFSTTATFTDSQWHYFVFTYKMSTASSAKMYVDGTSLSALWRDGTGNDEPSTTSTALRIGTTDPSFSEWLGGNISNVQIYNRALSANEVSQNFNATRARFGV
jgi:hypothetical protein